MDHYLECRLRRDPELTPQHLLNGLYARLHRALAQLGCQDIGVSFPEHDDSKPTLGGRVRLHGFEASLRTLMATGWIEGMLDHLHLSAITPVPTGVQHRRVSRVQAKSSPARLRRRAMRRHGLDDDTAQQRIPDTVAKRLMLPHVVIGSRSTGQPTFPLFVQHGPLLPEPVSGAFNSYGLSREATVPWF
ncbi:type I-F CRISPR-associated endoribonuclease Cas6/Csy4 [Coralloluteibacterium thermophilus]|uniref:Type I-F CRISPR-associated endoribonuclease Cas6/Csy4 n=1 Tax=Coralloluteibacterium thermophilum TaxID=2707049 RepID=A0ABV9NL13_9GAMM